MCQNAESGPAQAACLLQATPRRLLCRPGLCETRIIAAECSTAGPKVVPKVDKIPLSASIANKMPRAAMIALVVLTAGALQDASAHPLRQFRAPVLGGALVGALQPVYGDEVCAAFVVFPALPQPASAGSVPARTRRAGAEVPVSVQRVCEVAALVHRTNLPQAAALREPVASASRSCQQSYALRLRGGGQRRRSKRGLKEGGGDSNDDSEVDVRGRGMGKPSFGTSDSKRRRSSRQAEDDSENGSLEERRRKFMAGSLVNSDGGDADGGDGSASDRHARNEFLESEQEESETGNEEGDDGPDQDEAEESEQEESETSEEEGTSEEVDRRAAKMAAQARASMAASESDDESGDDVDSSEHARVMGRRKQLLHADVSEEDEDGNEMESEGREEASEPEGGEESSSSRSRGEGERASASEEESSDGEGTGEDSSSGSDDDDARLRASGKLGGASTAMSAEARLAHRVTAKNKGRENRKKEGVQQTKGESASLTKACCEIQAGPRWLAATTT